MFEKLPGKVYSEVNDNSYLNIASPVDCARNCRTMKNLNCRGFDYCTEEKTCILYDVDYNQENATSSNSTLLCNRFSRKKEQFANFQVNFIKHFATNLKAFYNQIYIS